MPPRRGSEKEKKQHRRTSKSFIMESYASSGSEHERCRYRNRQMRQTDRQTDSGDGETDRQTDEEIENGRRPRRQPERKIYERDTRETRGRHQRRRDSCRDCRSCRTERQAGGAARQWRAREIERDSEMRIARDSAEANVLVNNFSHFITKMVSMIKTWCFQQRAGSVGGRSAAAAAPDRAGPQYFFWRPKARSLTTLSNPLTVGSTPDCHWGRVGADEGGCTATAGRAPCAPQGRRPGPRCCCPAIPADTNINQIHAGRRAASDLT